MNWKQYITGAVVCLAIGYAIYRIVSNEKIKKEKNDFQDKETIFPQSDQYNSNKNSTDDAQQNIAVKMDEIKSSVKTENIDARAKEEFIKSCRDFYGSYESLHQICNYDLKDSLKLKLLQKWEKLIKINKLSALTALWKNTIRSCSGSKIESLDNASPDNLKLDEVAYKWLNKLEEWGVKRKDEEVIIINVSSTLYYDIDDMYKLGDKAKVIEKCWVLSKDAQGQELKEPIAIEKGLVKLIKEEAIN